MLELTGWRALSPGRASRCTRPSCPHLQAVAPRASRPREGGGLIATGKASAWCSWLGGPTKCPALILRKGPPTLPEGREKLATCDVTDGGHPPRTHTKKIVNRRKSENHEKSCFSLFFAGEPPIGSVCLLRPGTAVNNEKRIVVPNRGKQLFVESHRCESAKQGFSTRLETYFGQCKNTITPTMFWAPEWQGVTRPYQNDWATPLPTPLATD